MSHPLHYRLDDLRRLAAGLGASSGLSPPRATAFASHLLWFDAAGAPKHGIASLPTWLDRLDGGEIDPRAEGKLGPEHPGTLVLDGQNGLAPLILARAAGLAVEKARDVGLGAVRVENLGPAGPPAAVAAEAAIAGPEAAAVLGPGPCWALALPSPAGLPLVIDPSLNAPDSPPPAPLAPWSLLVPAGGWLILALGIRSLESLNAFHERVASSSPLGLLSPDAWDSRRRAILDHGLAPDPDAFAELARRAAALDLPSPKPVAGLHR